MPAPVAIDRAAPLLMLPGTLCDARVFAPMLAALNGGPAMAGRTVHHGTMTGYDNVHSQAGAILAEAPPRFIAVGFSLGAIVALHIAARAPERVAALVLIAGNARAVPAADCPMRRAMADLAPEDLVGNVLWPRSVAPSRLNDAALRTSIIAMARAAPPDTLRQQTELALTRNDKRARLASMAMPALVLGGARDAIAPPLLQQELAGGLPCATLRMIAEAGHFLPLEAPDACATALGDWLTTGHTPIERSSPMEVS